MAKKELKEELLKMLKSDMMGMKKESKKDLFGDMMPKKGMQKVTVMADSSEGLKKGLSKAEEIMQAKLGKKEYSEEECGMCGKMPCECEDED
jgi:predicted component of type VI protein secretion system